jgi:hypothetical protein
MSSKIERAAIDYVWGWFVVQVFRGGEWYNVENGNHRGFVCALARAKSLSDEVAISNTATEARCREMEGGG